MAKLHSGNFVITLEDILKALELSEDVKDGTVAITDVKVNSDGNIEFTIISAEFLCSRKVIFKLGLDNNNTKRQQISLT